MTEGNNVTEVENEDVVESVLIRLPLPHRRPVDIVAAVAAVAVAVSEEEGVEPNGVGVSVALAPVAEATLHDPVEVIAVIVTALARVVARGAENRHLPFAANVDNVVIAAGRDLLLHLQDKDKNLVN